MERSPLFTLPNLVSSSRVALAVGFVAYDAVPTRLALIGIAFGLGFFVGPFVTGWLVQYGLAAPIWLA